MTTMLIIGFAMLSLVAVGRLALPVVLRFLRSHRLTAANYAGKTIPVGSGLVLAVLFAAMYTFAELAVVVSGSETAWLPVKRADFAAFLVVFVAGWMDDAIGDRSVKGLSGHWRSFRLTHTPTTGGVKAAAIGLAALWLILHSGHSWAVMPIDWLILVLMANAVNLLDVRPGRAWKSFCLGGLLLACAQPDWRLCIWLLPCAAGAVTLMPGDLRGKYMLGDSGSNLLGFALGCAFVTAAPLWLRAVVLFALIAIHRVAEKSSITGWIERHRVARWLDRIGRA